MARCAVVMDQKESMLFAFRFVDLCGFHRDLALYRPLLFGRRFLSSLLTGADGLKSQRRRRQQLLVAGALPSVFLQPPRLAGPRPHAPARLPRNEAFFLSILSHILWEVGLPRNDASSPAPPHRHSPSERGLVLHTQATSLASTSFLVRICVLRPGVLLRR